MTEMERQLLQSLEELERGYNERESAWKRFIEEQKSASEHLQTRLEGLTKQVANLSEQVQHLASVYKTLAGTLRRT